MMDYINITSFVTPNVNWAQFAPFEPARPSMPTLGSHTRSALSKEDPFDLFVPAKGVYAPTALADARPEKALPRAETISAGSMAHGRDASSGDAAAEVDHIARQRVKLMAAKYASSTASAEIVARLEILNQRLLDRSPRVSREQVEALEDANEKLARIRAAREERAKRLGLTA